MKPFLKKCWEILGLRGSIVAAILALILFTGLQNMEPVDIDFIFWDLVEVPKLVFIFSLTTIGFVLGVIVGWGRGAR